MRTTRWTMQPFRRRYVTATVGSTVGVGVATVTGGLAAGLTCSIIALAIIGSIIAGELRSEIARSRRELSDVWSLTGALCDANEWPSVGGWALGADALLAWLQEIRTRNAKSVVELGPGSSSVLLGLVSPETSIVGIEHDSRYVELVTSRLRNHGVANFSVIYSPLTPVKHEKKELEWYDPSTLKQIPSRIDALLVDGPPNWEGKGNRAPAIQIIDTHMEAGGIVLVDDTDRLSERRMVESWVRSGRCAVLNDGRSFVLLEVV